MATKKKAKIKYIVREGGSFKFGGKNYKEGAVFTPPDGWERDLEHEGIVKQKVEAICFISVEQTDEDGEALKYRRTILPLVEKKQEK